MAKQMRYVLPPLYALMSEEMQIDNVRALFYVSIEHVDWNKKLLRVRFQTQILAVPEGTQVADAQERLQIAVYDQLQPAAKQGWIIHSAELNRQNFMFEQAMTIQYTDYDRNGFYVVENE